MPYIGQAPTKGDENNFKILDNISSYTLTFDGSDATVVSAANDTITSLSHRFVQGQRVTYNKGGGTVITGLSDGVYYIIKNDHNTIKLATSASNAANGTAVNITGVGGGSSHTLNVAFDGVNTKFKATHTNGQKAKITRSAQLVISINGVIQQPHDSATPSTGFGFDLDGTIVFSQAPVTGDVYWAHVLTNNNVTFDISDNDVDNFTGNGSTVSFNLSKTPPDNRNVLVTIDGVVQYPNDPDGTVRAYNIIENVLTFTVAPVVGAEIQVRHIGFAGSSSGSGGGGVTNFYGRTGSVVLKNTDNIVANNAEFAGNLTVQGTMTTLDTKLTEVDQLEVAANNTTVGVAITQSGSGDILKLYDGTSEVFTVANQDDGVGAVTISSPKPRIVFNETNASPDYQIRMNGGNFSIHDSTNDIGRISISPTRTDINNPVLINNDILYIGDKLVHWTDDDTAIRFPSANTISMETAGSTRFGLSSSGNIELHGTQTGNNVATIYNGTGFLGFYASSNSGVNRDFRFFSSNSNSNESLRITSAGQVGIGTDSPTEKVTILGNVLVKQFAGTDAKLELQETTTTNPLRISQTATEARIQTNSSQPFNIRSQSGSGSTGYLAFWTRDDERLRITSGGQVGIGSEIPAAKLDVVGGIKADGTIRLDNTASPTLYLTSTSTTGDGRIFFGDPDSDLVGRLSYVHNGDYYTFYAAYGERFRIAGNGDITVTSIDGNATGPTLKLFHNSASPAANDVVSRISMFGDDSAGNETEYGRIETKVDSVTDGQETAHINFATRGLGSYANVFRIKRRSTGSAPSYTTDDADGMILDVYNTGNPYPRYMNFIAKSAGNTDSNISFWTEAVGGSPTEKLRITSAGRVGINQNDPNTMLDIKVPPLNTATITTTNCLQLGMLLTAGGIGSNTAGHIYNGLAVGDGYAGLYGKDGGSGAATDLAFFTGTASAVSERMRIQDDGKIIIGNATMSINRNVSISAASGNSQNVELGLQPTNSSGGYNPEAYIGATADGTYGAAMYFYTRDTSGTRAERFKITSGGNALFGGTAVSQTNRQLALGSNSEANFAIETHNNAFSESSNIRFYKSRGTAASPTAVADNHYISQLMFYGHDGTDYANAAGYMRVLVDGTVANNQVPGQLQFGVNDGSSATTAMTIHKTGSVLFSGLTDKNDPRNAEGIAIKSASGISFQNYGSNGSHNWRIRPDDMVGWGTLEFAVSPTANSSTDWPDAATDVALCLKPEKHVVIPNGRLGVGLNGTPSATFEVTDGGDLSYTKMGWARKRTFSLPIINNEQRWYKIVNYQAGNMLVGRLEIYTSRGGGFNQTKGYNEWRVSYGGYTSGGTGTIYGTAAENTSFQSGTGNSVDLVKGDEGGTNENIYIKVPGSVYSGRVYFIFEGIFANWQLDDSTYLTSAP